MQPISATTFLHVALVRATKAYRKQLRHPKERQKGKAVPETSYIDLRMGSREFEPCPFSV